MKYLGKNLPKTNDISFEIAFFSVQAFQHMVHKRRQQTFLQGHFTAVSSTITTVFVSTNLLRGTDKFSRILTRKYNLQSVQAHAVMSNILLSFPLFFRGFQYLNS